MKLRRGLRRRGCARGGGRLGAARRAFEPLESRQVLNSGYLQLNLVSDQASTALVQDANLVAAWGTGLNPSAGAFWVADKGTGVATLYGGDVTGSPFVQNALVVSIPGGSPTGVAFNGTTDFQISSGGASGPATFLFAGETAQVSGWNQNVPAGSTSAIHGATTASAVYKGLALANNAGTNLLYAANFHAGTIDVFNTNFQPVALSVGAFTDASIPAGFAPFNVENFGGELYVTYAKQDGTKQNDVPGAGNGFVDVFNPDGSLSQRLIIGQPGNSASPLNSPYGMALAPANFGDWSGDLLVANSGDGLIHAFNPSTGALLGTLTSPGGAAISIDGLKDLRFGNGQTAGDANKLFFSAAPSGGQHGLFGSLESAQGVNLTAEGARFGATASVAFSGVVATFADPNAAGGFNVMINWGDGFTTQGGAEALSGGGFDVTGMHTYMSAGTFNVGITIMDPQGNTANALAQAVVTVPPPSLAGTTINPTEGTGFSATVATLSDSDGNMNPAAYTATIQWGDGTITSGTLVFNGMGFNIQGSHTYAEEGSDTITVSVTDSDGTVASVNSVANVLDAPLTASGTSIATTSEGHSFTLPVAFSDADPNGTAGDYSATIQWGDGSSSVNVPISGSGPGFTVIGTHTYADEGTFTATVTIADAGGSSAIATTTAQVAEADVLAGTAAAVSATEGKAVSGVLATFSDGNSAAAAGDFTASIDWGDGTITSGTVTGAGGLFSVNGIHTYADEASHTVTVTLADDGAGSAGASVSYTLSVADADVLAATLISPSPTEGLAFSGNVATISDSYSAAAAGDFTAAINWGDGTITSGTVAGGSVAGGGSVFTVAGSHTYAEEGSYTAVVTFTDDSPGTASATASGSVVVADAALAASAVTLSGTEGVTLNSTVATFTDANPNAAAGDFTATIVWGDGTSSSGTVTGTGGSFAVNGLHTYGEGGSYTVGVTIDDHGATASASSTANVADYSLTASGTTISPTEGSPFSSVVATFSDADPDGGSAGEYTATIAWGDGKTTTGSVTGSNGNYTVSGTHTFADESSGLTITIADAGGATATTTTVAQVADADVLSAHSPITIASTEGATVSRAVATFTDPFTANTAADFTASINWGDGTITAGTVSGSGANYTISGAHTYAKEGTYSATATISDGEGGNSTTADFTVKLSDPAVSASGGLTFTAAENATSAAQAVATFTDPGGPEKTTDYSASIDWGDGSSSAGSISYDSARGVFTVSASHLYTAAGTDTITVAISHEGAALAAVTSTATVVDPPLVATGGSTFSAVEGATTTAQTVATFTDPGGDLPAASYAATIAWGDTTLSAGAVTGPDAGGVYTVAGSHSYSGEGSQTISVTIAHGTAPVATASSNAAIADVALAVTQGATFTAVEGILSAVQPLATFSDPAGAERTVNYSAMIFWGDGGSSGGLISFNTATQVFTVSGSHLYAQEVSPTVAISMTIAHGTAADATVGGTATVSDPPVAASASSSFSPVEGTSTSGLAIATFTDPGGAEAASQYSATIDWGGGNSSAGTIVANTQTGVFTVSGDHNYAEDGPISFSVTIRHGAAPNATVAGTATVQGVPVAVSGGTFSAGEGATATATTLATFTDPAGAEALGNYSATIDWGDGTTASAGSISFDSASGVFTVSGAHLYAEQGAWTATATVVHDGFDATATSLANVTDPPVAASGGLSFVATEGSMAAAQPVATFTDPAGAEALSDYTATIAWGDGSSSAGTVSFDSTAAVFTVSGAHLYADQNGIGPIRVTIHHDASADATAVSSASIVDPPVVVVPVNATAAAGAANVPVANFTDPAGAEPAGDYSAAVAWGDGSTVAGTIAFNPATGAFTVSASPPADLEATNNTLQVTIGHESATSATVTSQVTVSEPPMIVSPVAVAGREFIALTNVTVATFTHPAGDPAGDFSATIDWGDGTTTAGTVTGSNGNYGVVGTHTYGDEGNHTIVVTVSEEGVMASVAGSATIGQELLPIADPAHPTANELYVAEVYTDVLKRRVDPGGLQFWAGQLDAGAPRDVVARQLTHSAEYYANIVIQPAYERFLGRAADPGGLAYWVAQMQNGLTDQQLEAGFIGADEFFTHAGGTNRLWVDALYEDLLGRPPDAQGEAFWVAQLAAGAGRSNVAQGFVDSPEREAIRITQDYVDFLGRSPSPAEVDAWVQQFENGVTNEDVVTGFVASDEYYLRVLSEP